MSDERRMRHGPECLRGLLALSLLSLGACGGDGAGDDGTGPDPEFGAVRVAASTTGEDRDPDGYSVTLDGGATRALGVDAAATFPDVEPGGHALELADVAGNCAVQGENPRNVSVTAGATAETGFEITCTPLGPTATALAFTIQPEETELHQALAAVEVAILDEAGDPMPGATDEVTMMLGTTAGDGTLRGTTTVSAVDGVARFEDLALDLRANGYTLVAGAEGLEGAESEPFDVTLAWAEVTAGGLHTCGRTAGGVAYCWGFNGNGQLGDGNQSGQSEVPVPVATELRFVRLSAGIRHTCGLTADDQAYCWGANGFGQLGDGRGGTNSGLPRLVGHGIPLERVSAGNSYSCGLTPDAVALCWGFNGQGQLGDGNTGTNRDFPVAVDTDLTFLAVSAGHSHTCALTGTDAYCWGDNGVGALGNGSFDDSAVPVLVQGGHTFVEVGAGAEHSCALTPSNDVFCWGSNGSGQLGIGDLDTESATVPVQVAGDLVFQIPSLAVGLRQTCAIGFGLGSFCWGSNSFGQLGDGSTGQDRESPVAVEGGHTFSIDTGNLHTCGVTPAGEAFCWGFNENGRLGDGNAGTDSDTPVRVLDPPQGTVP